MGKRVSLYMAEPLDKALEGYDERRSERVNAVCGRYLAVVEHATPTWPRKKWCAVCDALNGYYLGDEASIRMIWAEIADHEGLGDKWGVDQKALVEELRAMAFAGKIAVVEIVEKFWQRSRDVDALAIAGAKISHPDPAHSEGGNDLKSHPIEG